MGRRWDGGVKAPVFVVFVGHAVKPGNVPVFDLRGLHSVVRLLIGEAVKGEALAILERRHKTVSGEALEICFINPEIEMVWLSPQKNMRNYFVDVAFTIAELTNQPEKLGEVVLQTLFHDRYKTVRNEQIFSFFADETEACLEKLYEEILRDCMEG